MQLGKHFRVPWRHTDPQEILVHCRFDEIKGTYKKDEKQAAALKIEYDKAKLNFDMGSAIDLVKKCIDPKLIDIIIDKVIENDAPPIVIAPHPEFDSDKSTSDILTPTNALPLAFANYLARELGCEVDSEIIEFARPGRTKLKRFPRFLWQPAFSGSINTKNTYIMVDDNCTLGGTFAMLRSYIVGNGGKVIAVSALSSPDGKTCRFPIANDTIDVLISTYGEEISPLWIEEVGHDIPCITESEGIFLVEWIGKPPPARDISLNKLRDRLNSAKAKGL